MGIMEKLLSVFLVMAILNASLSSAMFSVKKNSFAIVSPVIMHSSHDSSISKFGIPDAADSVVGSLVYPSYGGGSRAFGCHPFDSQKPSPSNNSLPTVFLLDRGDCYFALKIWNSQEAGADAVLIGDYIEEPVVNLDFAEDDDRSSIYSRISIPSALIKKSLAEMMKKALHEGDEVVVKLEWRNPGDGGAEQS